MYLIMGFMKSVWQMAWYWRVWIGMLMVMNGFLPFLFLETIEAKVVLMVFMLAAVTQMIIYHSKGFVRLLGIGHIYWFPMLGWLLVRVSAGMAPETVLNWIISLIVLNAASLSIDVVDVMRYWRGERLPTIVVNKG